uniref:ABEC1 enzyme n=1 Tax=Zonotrichia albicollis TaxID=44394 RepID=A0A8D2NAB5_ZONAL
HALLSSVVIRIHLFNCPMVGFHTYYNQKYTHCLYLEWRGGIRSWKHWVRNDDVNDCHAEQYFLEEIFEPRCYNICDMTWYLSYSPCWKCCDVIRDFLEEQTNVNIYIHVARLYYVNHPNNCRALRELNSLENVTIEAMEAEDTLYCWRNFVAHQPGQDDYWPQNVTLYFILNSIELLHIFLVSRHLKKTPGAKINAKKKNPRKRRFG